MTTASNLAASEQRKNFSIAKYLGPAPLIDGEDFEAYQNLLEQMTARVGPNGPIEEILLRDIVDLTWESLRWRRYVAALVSGLMRSGALQILHSLLGSSEAARLSRDYETGKSGALTAIANALGKVGLSMDVMATNAVAARASDLQRLQVLQDLAAGAEARRNTALNEMGKHQAFASMLRKASEEIIDDAEFEEAEKDRELEHVGASAVHGAKVENPAEAQGHDQHDQPEEDRGQPG